MPERSTRPALRARQLCLVLPAIACGVFAAASVAQGESGFAAGAYAVALGLNMGLLTLSSWSGILGALVVLAERCGLRVAGPRLAPPTGRARTAILMPIYEEDPVRIFAAAGAMADDCAGERLGPVDLFVLSDTQSAAGIAREEAAAARFFALRAAEDHGGPAIFHRRRTRNTGRKAGNIADFCARWGGDYDFMVILDADSLMTGRAVAALVGAMEAEPRAGLIQAMCYPIGRASLFARIQQFGARLDGPLLAKGVAFWQGPHGSYWGHNAILRVAAFAAHCGLPTLPGRAPLGGEILCHDTVEAALMLRGGWDVWMVPQPLDEWHGGSWEQTPTNLVDHLDRDRRWCQGNLQHGALLPMDGLRAASLMHLGQGILHYLSAPLFLALLALSIAAPPPASPHGDRALIGLALVMLFAPRILSLAVTLFDRDASRRFGGRLALTASAILHQLFGFVVGPVTLVLYTTFVATTVAGRIVRWDRQERDDRGLRWREACLRLGLPVAVSLGGIVAVAQAAPLIAVTLGPGLLLALPVAVWSSRPGAGRAAARAGLFAIPEETHAPDLVRRVGEAERRLRSRPDGTTVAAVMAAAPLPRGQGRPLVPQPMTRRAWRRVARG